MKTHLAVGVLLLTILSSCSVIRPGQVGIKQSLGRIKRDNMGPGAYLYNPFTSSVKKINTRTVEALNDLDVPTKEGLTVRSEISLLYHVRPDAAKEVYTRYGMNYQEVIVESNFRAVARHQFAQYFAKELFAIDRKKIETQIYDELKVGIEDKGFVVDAVLLKSITMPPQIFQAVENKLKMEQEALQMEYVIQKQHKEAERMQIEAEAIKKYNQTVNEGLTELMIKWQGIRTLQELVTSNNAKVIITDGKSPMILNTDK